jgi:hypothetical protein
MTIRKITDFKVVYVCPDHNEKYHERNLFVQKLLHDIGFKHFIHYKSGSEKYPIPLIKAVMDILIKYMDEPVLIVEDDIEFTGEDTFDFVEDADAIYFGLCRLGAHPTEPTHINNCSYEPYSEHQVRLKNMVCQHAVMYISPKFKRAVIEKLLQHLEVPHPKDIVISRMMPDFKVLANKKPAFFQSCKFNLPVMEYITNCYIDNNNHIQDFKFNKQLRDIIADLNNPKFIEYMRKKNQAK